MYSKGFKVVLVRVSVIGEQIRIPLELIGDRAQIIIEEIYRKQVMVKLKVESHLKI